MQATPRRRIGTAASALMAGAFIAGATPAAAAAAASVHSVGDADTTVTLVADADGPRLESLAARDGFMWHNRAVDALPPAAHWHYDAAASRFAPDAAELVYTADSPRLKLVWAWRAREARGPLEHTLTVENLGTEPVWLPLIPSLRYDWQIDPRTALQRFWVEKGADLPTAHGVHADPLGEGDDWSGASSTYARPFPDRPDEMIPYALVHERDGAQRGWYVGLEWSGRTHITLERRGDSVRGEAGLDPEPGPYRTRLEPGATFSVPPVFLGVADGGPDGAGNRLRRWVRAALNNPRTLEDSHYPLLVSNSWGSGTAVDETLAHHMILDAQSLGLEMYHLDAGWFRAVGDWEPDPVKFPHGVRAVADDAHAHGLKFGLWIDWTQAGVSTRPGALNVEDPQVRGWLLADPPPGWKHAEEYKGITLDLGLPAVQAWASGELEALVHDNDLDMLEHDGYLLAQGSSRTDHPAAPPAPGTLRVYEDAGYVWATGSNDTDVSYHAVRAYYAIYEELRRRHPRLLFEICNDGGRMVDFGSAAHGDYFSITDHYDPLSNRRAFYDASYVLPPAMLETYVEKWPTPTLANLRYQLRSGMQGWFSLMLDTSQWSAEQRRVAKAEFALYKDALRPLIREADLYHVGDRPDGVHWDGVEYYSATQGRGVLFAFRGSATDEPAHRFPVRGVEAGHRYRLHFQDRGAAADRVAPDRDALVSGAALARAGIEVALPEPNSSELVFIRRID